MYNMAINLDIVYKFIDSMIINEKKVVHSSSRIYALRGSSSVKAVFLMLFWQFRSDKPLK